jgi:hypothetical protein
MDMHQNRNNSLVGLSPLVLFLSSYIPLFGLIALRQFYNNLTYLNWCGFNKPAIMCFVSKFGISVLCLVIIVFGLIGTYFVFRFIEKDSSNGATIEIKDISSLNDEPIAYLATYIVSIMFQDYSNIADVVTVLILFFIVYRLFVSSKLLLVNPILGLKFSIYSFTFIDGSIQRQGIVITKNKDIQEGDQVQIYNIGYQLYFGNKRIIS